MQEENTAPTEDVTPDVDQNVEPAEVEETEEVQQENPVQETTVEEPEATEIPAETEEEEDDYVPVEIPDIPSLDLSQVPLDEDGNYDPNALVQQMNNQMQRAVEAAVAITEAKSNEKAQEEKLWNKAVDKFPQLKTNRELRDLVHKNRVGSIIEGKNPTPLEVAETLFKHLGTAKSEGAKSATETVRVQRSAQLETSSRASDNQLTKSQQLLSQIRSQDRTVAEKARQDYIRAQLFGEE